jgi:UrcA family protein
MQSMVHQGSRMVRLLKQRRKQAMFTNFSETIARATLGILGTTVFAGLCLMGAAAPATASPVNIAPTVSVSYAGLDLTSAADRAELDHRIARTARKLCGASHAGTREIILEVACVKASINDARAQLSAKTAKAGG